MAKITDLSKIPPPEVVKQLDYEAILAARKERFINEYPSEEQEYWRTVLALESEPVTKLLEECAYAELLFRQELNESAQSLMLAYAKGADLDQIAANYDIERLVIQAADDAVNPPKEEILESDEALRRRVQEAFEVLSTAGPEAAYINLARRADGSIKDVSAVSPSPAHVVVTVLGHAETGVVEKVVLDKVSEAVNAKNRRPVADRVEVKAAEVLEYRVEATLKMYATPDYVPILTKAEAALKKAVEENFLIGRDVSLSMIYKALRVEGVQDVAIAQPVANIAVSPTQAARCVGITVNWGGWNE